MLSEFSSQPEKSLGTSRGRGLGQGWGQGLELLVLGHEGDQRTLRILGEWLPRAGVNSGKKISTSRGSDQGSRPIVIIII